MFFALSVHLDNRAASSAFAATPFPRGRRSISSFKYVPKFVRGHLE